MGLPNVARYPEATVVRDETSILIRFGGPYGQQKMSVPLQYVGEDAGRRNCGCSRGYSRSATASGVGTPHPLSRAVKGVIGV